MVHIGLLCTCAKFSEKELRRINEGGPVVELLDEGCIFVCDEAKLSARVIPGVEEGGFMV